MSAILLKIKTGKDAFKSALIINGVLIGSTEEDTIGGIFSNAALREKGVILARITGLKLAEMEKKSFESEDIKFVDLTEKIKDFSTKYHSATFNYKDFSFSPEEIKVLLNDSIKQLRKDLKYYKDGYIAQSTNKSGSMSTST